MHAPGSSFPTLIGKKHFYFVLVSLAFRKSTAVRRWYSYNRSFYFPSPLSAFCNLRITPVPTVPALPAIYLTLAPSGWLSFRAAGLSTRSFSRIAGHGYPVLLTSDTHTYE